PVTGETSGCWQCTLPSTETAPFCPATELPRVAASFDLTNGAEAKRPALNFWSPPQIRATIAATIRIAAMPAMGSLRSGSGTYGALARAFRANRIPECAKFAFGD